MHFKTLKVLSIPTKIRISFALIPLLSKTRVRFLTKTISIFFLVLLSPLTWADYSHNTKAALFIDDMVKTHHFDKAELTRLFIQAEKKDSILKAISRPAEKRLEWSGYRKIFLTAKRIEKGRAFLKQYQETFARAEQKFGVPSNIIAAIIGVETRYGRQKGNYRVIDALSTLAFDYPPRSKFFTSELEQLLLLAKEQGFKALDLTGSYAGAMGYGQFIPSSYRHYALDFDNDKVADILNNPVDAIGSVANYFAKHKWHAGEPVAIRLSTLGNVDISGLTSKNLKPNHSVADLKKAGITLPEKLDPSLPAKIQVFNGAEGVENWITLHNFYVITRYNHSHLYAMAVFQLAEELKNSK